MVVSSFWLLVQVFFETEFDPPKQRIEGEKEVPSVRKFI